MSAVIELDSSDDDNEVVEVTETTSEVDHESGPKMCLNPMGRLAKSQGFVKEFVDLINLCFKFESSLGMERILTKNLIPNYKQLNSEYAKSDKLKCYLRNIIKKLKNAPNMKFCFLKEVSENFKANQMKKKVDFVTLNTKASEKFKKYYEMQNEKKNKKKQDNIIILDENEDPHPQIINLDEEQPDVIDLESCDNTNNDRTKMNGENCVVTKLTNECDIIIRPKTKTREHIDSTKRVSHKFCKENKSDCNVVLDSQEMDQTGNIHRETHKTVHEKNMAHSNKTQDTDCDENLDQTNDESMETNHTVHMKNMTHTVNKKILANSKNIIDSDCDENMDYSDKEQIETNDTIHKKNMAPIVNKKNLANSNNIIDSDCEENMDQSNNQSMDTNRTVHRKNKADSNNIKNTDCGNMAHSNNIEDSDSDENMDESNSDTIELDHTSNCNTDDENLNNDTQEIPSNNNNYKSSLDNDLLNVSHVRPHDELTALTVLELEIKRLKGYLITLEEMEVVINNCYSPYMEAHKTKLLIIEKYKMICQLRGEAYKPRKCRQFQLKVKEGHPAGPARKLQEWLNSNTDKNGEPSFPNLRDVILCVWVANQEDNLGWDINRTYHEARILFNQCGQHLQRRRQQREWRDLLQTVTSPVEQDPADTDPQLRDKLEANRLMARVKFDGIIEHYAKLEEESRKKTNKVKPIKITDVKSLSVPNAQPTWEVPITGTISEVPVTEVPITGLVTEEPVTDLPITGFMIEEVPITGLIQLNPNAPSNNENKTYVKQEKSENQTKTDVKKDVMEDVVNNSTENSNNGVISNKTSNNLCEVALEIYNSIKKDNIKTYIQTNIDRGQTDNNVSQNIKNSHTCHEIDKTVNTNKTIEQNDVKNNNDNDQKESLGFDSGKSSSIVYGKHQICKIKSPVIDLDENYKLSPEVNDQNNSSSINLASQKASGKIDGIEKMDIEGLPSQNEKVNKELGSQKKERHSAETMEIEKITQNVHELTNTVTKNTQLDFNSKSYAIEESNRTSNDQDLTDNDKNKTNNDQDLTDNDKNKTTNDKHLTNNDKNLTNNDENPTNNDKHPSNNDTNPKNNDKNKKTGDTNPTNNDIDLSTDPNDKSKIKSEVKMEIDFSEEDFDLMLDQNFSCDTMASARVFDVEDTVVFIELSSSESESDDDDCQFIDL